MNLDPILLAELQRGGPALWASGRTYPVGAEVRSPSNLQRYVRVLAGSGTTDPSSDSANWLLWSKRVEDAVATVSTAVGSVGSAVAQLATKVDAQGGMPTLDLLVASSRSITVKSDGRAVVTAMGGGAGGARSFAPGNSAGWGIKAFPVRAGDVIAIAIAAGGAPVTVSGTPAQKGGDTVVSLNGTVIAVAPGGGAGPSAFSVKAPVSDAPTGMDYWISGRQPQGDFGSGYMGGAAVDLGGGTYKTSEYYGDHAVGSPFVGVPIGTIVAGFGICLSSSAFGSPGIGSAPGITSSIFGGGSGTADSGGLMTPPGRGGSAGANQGLTTQTAGGAGFGRIRLYI